MNEEVATFSCSRKINIKGDSPDFQDVQSITVPRRTQGDGMENNFTTKIIERDERPNKSKLGETLIYHPTNLKQSSMTPSTPSGQIVTLIPKTPIKKRDRHVHNPLKIKEPKFIPYEPYKAAVNPIVPYDKRKNKSSKNNLKVDILTHQFINLKTEEIHENSSDENKLDNKNEGINNLKQSYKNEIQKLRDENSQLENQLKFQAQVNGELKNLLVAAVGEDLETRVHLLTEDKLQLAQALLNSAQHLNTHQEQTEWLAGQCEVWRSKFLASSLMVEDLAKWKAALCQRTTDFQESIKRLLEELSRIRETSLKTYKNLSILQENFDPFGVSKNNGLTSMNAIDVTHGCYHLSELLKVHLLSGLGNINLRNEINKIDSELRTPAEKNAEQLLMNANILIPGKQDAACSAVMGAAVALASNIFSPRSSDITCCPHCSGKIEQI